MFRMTVACVTALFLSMPAYADTKTPVGLTKAQLTQVKGAIARDMLDPDAAKFRDVRAVDVTKSNGKIIRRVCGEVNGKNAYGAYVGYSMFGGVIANGRFKRKDFFGACE